LLWSDPIEAESANICETPEDWAEWYALEYENNEARGCGYVTGYTAVDKFLKDNQLSCVLRAHEVQKHGYREHFFHRESHGVNTPLMITVFSCPNCE
jgi:serine/threonine-protein phosphatase 2B catalytic subunit